MYSEKNKLINSFSSFNLNENDLNYFNFLFEGLPQILINTIPSCIETPEQIFTLFVNEYYFESKSQVDHIEVAPNLSLYIPYECFSKDTNQVVQNSLLIANLPFILPGGGYLDNDLNKVYHRQLLFNPTLFFYKSKVESRVTLYSSVTNNPLISIVLETKGGSLLPKCFFSFADSKRKYSIFLLLECFNLDYYEIFQNVLISTEKRHLENVNLINAKLLECELDSVTRYHLNQKLNINLDVSTNFLTAIDIKLILKHLLAVYNGFQKSDDVDDINNNLFFGIENLFQKLFYITFKDWFLPNPDFEEEPLIPENIEPVADYADNHLDQRTIPNPLQDTVKTDHETNADENQQKITKTTKSNQDDLFSDLNLQEILVTSDVSLVLDDVNPISSLSQTRKVLRLEKQENNDNVSIKVRDIHPTFYGNICILETPEGESAGLIQSLTTFSLINKFGFIETPSIEILNNRVQVQKSLYYLENKKIVFSEFITNPNFFIEKTSQTYKLATNKLQVISELGRFQTIISYMQIFSVVCNLIPFFEHNDGNRMLMGSSMQKQAVPLNYMKNPIVGTLIDEMVIASTDIIKSFTSGHVEFVNQNKISIKTKDNKHIIYSIHEFLGTEKETAIMYSPNVFVGDFVYFGEILVNGFSSISNDLALGTNIISMYGVWEGFNFEDSLVISERLLKENILTSTHIKQLTVELEKDEFMFLVDDFISSDELLMSYQVPIDDDDDDDSDDENNEYDDDYDDYTDNDDEDLYENEYDTLDSAPIDQTDDTDIDSTENLKSKDESEDTEDNESYVAHEENDDYENFDYDNLIEADESTDFGNSEFVPTDNDNDEDDDALVDDPESKLELDSRLNNLNEFGIIKSNTYVLPDDFLLVKRHLNDENSFDIVIADFEGFILSVDTTLVEDSKDVTNSSFSNCLLTFSILQIKPISCGDKLSGRFGNKGIISKILPKEDMPFLIDGTPVDIIINPLGVPSRMNIGQIYEGLLGLSGFILKKRYKMTAFNYVNTNKLLVTQKLLEAQKKSQIRFYPSLSFYGRQFVRDGRSGEFLDNPLFIGVNYILRLIHIVDEKILARSLGPVSSLTNQPLRGKANLGGQRFGEMEMWALEAYGAAYSIKDFVTLKTDDVIMASTIPDYQRLRKLVYSVHNLASRLYAELDLIALGFAGYNSKYDLEFETKSNDYYFNKFENVFINS